MLHVVARDLDTYPDFAIKVILPGHDIPSIHHRQLRAAALDTWRQIARLHTA